MIQIPKCKSCNGVSSEWLDNDKIWECEDCEGSGNDLSIKMCWECGAKNLEECDKLCKCAGDKDWCHGCIVWPE
jgi:hypothetical protein